MLRPRGEDPLAGIEYGQTVGFEGFEQLEVDQVSEPWVLARVRELFGDRVQLLRDLPALGKHEHDVRTRKADRIEVRPGQSGEFLLAGVERRDLKPYGREGRARRS